MDVTRMEQLGAWPVRALWLLLALAAGGVLDDALEGRSTPVTALTIAVAGAGWTAGAVALLVPRTSSLTAARVLVPAGLAGTLVAAQLGAEPDGADLAAVVAASLATVAVLAPWVGDQFADGSSYGPERRFLLRAPVAFTFALTPFTWVAVVLGSLGGPYLLAAEQWIPGLLAVAIGWPLAWAGASSLHQLSRRWVVFVPTGFVLHDPLTMPEPQLFPRRTVRSIGPAPAGTDAQDLTLGAPGLALQVDLAEPVDLLVRAGARASTTDATMALLVTPTRPAKLLAEARSRRLPVSVPAPA